MAKKKSFEARVKCEMSWIWSIKCAIIADLRNK